MKLDKLTNNQLLRKIQDLTEEHERKKSEILKLCKDIDNIELEYKQTTEYLSKRMSGKE